ncbi:hypothetical protein HPB48_018311 [Haemaphysalis longicornis]|uniref:AAA+ ATPase domain-containing protein n=1 Tax=Haemaphysalis longicornis TaxID=44386 RepID=A0A9J6FR18_HAELO|nr:hypothetical protein HPB48_018311 [Haemaphysalis longicornis]
MARKMAGIPALEDASLRKADQAVGDGVSEMTMEEIIRRANILDGEIARISCEITDVANEVQLQGQKIKELRDSIAGSTKPPYLVARVVELLDVDPDEHCEGGGGSTEPGTKGKWVIINASMHDTYFRPLVGFVDAEKLRVGDLVVVKRGSYIILETLPKVCDWRVKAMEVDERPTELFTDIGGLDKQIQELVEAVVLPLTHNDKITNLGKNPPKGVILYGPPGTGKTLLARACAAETKSAFIKLAGAQLVEISFGDGGKMVREAFALAKEKAPAIIFVDELDSIGSKRFCSDRDGDREFRNIILELLSQLDEMSPSDDVKVIAATSRVDILHPALLRYGRLGRKIELPLPDEDARARIIQVHSRKMNFDEDVNFEELARCTHDFNGAQCKAVCVEAGMIALERDSESITREDYMVAIKQVQSRKKVNLDYYT